MKVSLVVLTAGKAAEDEHDQFLTIAKQRHGEYEGTLGLWFDPKALAFSEFSHAELRPIQLPRRSVLARFLRFELVDVLVAMNGAFLINSGMVIVAACVALKTYSG